MRKHLSGKYDLLKKILSVCIVVLLLGSMVAPAFASEAPETEQREEEQEYIEETETQSESEENFQEQPESEISSDSEGDAEITESSADEAEEDSNEQEEIQMEKDDKSDSETTETEDESEELFISDETEALEYEKMSDELETVANNSLQLMSVFDVSEMNEVEENQTFGGKTISVSKGWRGDESSTGDRPSAVTFELYASNSDTPVDTLTLTADDATTSGGSTWKGTFSGKYPIYDENGERITYTVREVSVTAKDKSGKDTDYKLDENQTVTYPTEYDKKGNVSKSATYRSVQDSDNTTTSEGYGNVSAFVPVTEIEEGVDYLVSSGNSGNVRLYRAEAYQTDNMITTADGDVSAVSGGRTIEGFDSNGTKTAYSNYILVADDETGMAVGEDGKYLTDYMTWRAQHVSNNTGVLASNFYRLCGLVENGDEDRYQGYMSTEKDKGDGLCVYKKNIASLSEAPAATQFTYDSATGGFKTPGSDKVVYLYRKITLADGTLENETQTVGMTNWKNSSTEDPLDTGDQSEPESYTDVSVNKVWADGGDHTGETVTVSLYANGTEVKEMEISAGTDWKGTFESLPSKDADGNDISYTIGEKTVKDSSGKVISYISAVEDTTDPQKEKTKVWLPVDRPSKKEGGEDYIVIAFPSTKSEIGQNIWGNGSATRKALTSNTAGTKFAMGDKNSGNTDGASMDVVVTEGPITVGGKTYTNYITDDQAHNSDGSLRETIMWRVGYVGTASASVASHADYGPWPRDLYYFKALAGKGGYLSTQGDMTLGKTIDTSKYENNRSLFAYGMMYSSDWGEFKSMTKQGYTEDQITHMIGAMDHYALRSDKSPGKFGESDCTYPAMYLYKGVEVTNKSYTITNTSKAKITARKIWDDNDNADQKRPASVSIELIRNGSSTGKMLYLSDSNGWQATFDQLDTADADGNAYTYSVKEHVADSDSYETTYETETDENGNLLIKITNKLKAVVDIPVQKVWSDGNDKHSGDSIEIQLLADGTAYGDKVTLNNKNSWKYIYKNLPKYREDGKTEIEYTVEEIRFPGYRSKITGDMEEGYTITNTPGVITMPETGSNSRLIAMLSGFLILTGGVLLMINNKKRGVIGEREE